MIDINPFDICSGKVVQNEHGTYWFDTPGNTDVLTRMRNHELVANGLAYKSSDGDITTHSQDGVLTTTANSSSTRSLTEEEAMIMYGVFLPKDPNLFLDAHKIANLY